MKMQMTNSDRRTLVKSIATIKEFIEQSSLNVKSVNKELQLTANGKKLYTPKMTVAMTELAIYLDYMNSELDLIYKELNSREDNNERKIKRNN